MGVWVCSFLQEFTLLTLEGGNACTEAMDYVPFTQMIC